MSAAASAPRSSASARSRASALVGWSSRTCGVAATIRRSVLDEVGGFDESLRAAEDYDLWLRVAAAGHRAVRVPELCAVYRLRESSLSRNQALMLSSLRRVYERVAGEAVSAEAQAAARRRLATIEALAKPPGLSRRGRAAAGAIKRRVLDGRLWYETPPAEVAAIFPDIGAL